MIWLIRFVWSARHLVRMPACVMPGIEALVREAREVVVARVARVRHLVGGNWVATMEFMLPKSFWLNDAGSWLKTDGRFHAVLIVWCSCHEL